MSGWHDDPAWRYVLASEIPSPAKVARTRRLLADAPPQVRDVADMLRRKLNNCVERGTLSRARLDDATNDLMRMMSNREVRE